MRKFLQNLGIKILPTLFNLLVKTLKIEIRNRESIESGNFVLMFWHGKMLCGWLIGKDKNYYGVVSQSKDGEILSSLLLNWKYYLIRGSSSKDSREVMKQMVEVLMNGFSLALTPDGPRGPRGKMKIGGLIAAIRSEKPVVLCGIKYEKKIIFNSWDKFELPKPFSKVTINLSNQKRFPQGLSNEEYEQIRQELEKELNQLCWE